MSEVWLLRVGILVAGLILLAAIWYFGTRPRSSTQGRRVKEDSRGKVRREPSLAEGADLEREVELADGQPLETFVQTEIELDDADGFDTEPKAEAGSDIGRRTTEDFDKIVTLFVAARAGKLLHGPDIVVAAEKVGLTYGHMNVFHRLLEGHPERGPLFSVANINKPGSFEMSEIQSLETPAIAFFLTLPAPVSALDAWDAMQPTAQRFAELLDGVLLDEQRNALGRQRIAHIRDELRGYDRQRAGLAAGKFSR